MLGSGLAIGTALIEGCEERGVTVPPRTGVVDAAGCVDILLAAPTEEGRLAGGGPKPRGAGECTAAGCAAVAVAAVVPATSPWLQGVATAVVEAGAWLLATTAEVAVAGGRT